MDNRSSPVRRVTRASRKRASSTATENKGASKRKRTKGPVQPSMEQQTSAAKNVDMRENKMQTVSVGLYKIPPRLCCKENLTSEGTTTTSRAANKRHVSLTEQSSVKPTDQLNSNTALQTLNRPALHLFEDLQYVNVTDRSPLPPLQWAQSAELWRTMRGKDIVKSAPEVDLSLQHPGIVPSMRVILLDWMLEVCEEYRLHRETYYLAKDMYDRFMDIRTGVLKEQLQLIGVTCLFVASKIEEIYPPKVGEFAYVTDRACSVANIIEMELVICKTLKWRLNHNVVTVNTWVNTYVQLESHQSRPPGLLRDFELPAFSPLEFTKIMQLLDLCTLDMNSRQFGSSVVAASALYLMSEHSRAHLSLITGFDFNDIRVCVHWMYPYALVFLQKGAVCMKTFNGVIPQDSHNIQTHEVSMAMLDDAQELSRGQELLTMNYQESSVFLTPPRSERRCLAPINTTY